MRLTILILSLAFISCTNINFAQSGGYTFNGIDFREFTEKGFQFTPENPEGEYQSVGIIEVDFYPEIVEIDINTYNTAKRNGGYVIGNKDYSVQRTYLNNTAEYFAIEKFNTDSLLNEIYELASGWGANAIVNLRFESESFTTGITWSKVSVRGFAIKKEF